MEPQTTELLITLCEVAAAFVGFSLVSSVLDRGDSSRSRLLSTRDVAEVSLFCVFMSLLPLLVDNFAFAHERNWQVSSAAFVFFWVTGAYRGIQRFRSQGLQIPASLLFGFGCAAIGNIGLVYNVIAPGVHAAAIYLVALTLLLAFAGLSFITATFPDGVSDR